MKLLGGLALAFGFASLACADSPAAAETSEATADSASEQESQSSTSSAEASTEDSAESQPETESETAAEAESGPSCVPGPSGLSLQGEGDFLAQAESISGQREHCMAAVHAIAGAGASSLRLTLDSYSGAGELRVRVDDLLGDPLVDWQSLGAGASIELTLAQSGEALVRLEPVDPLAPADDYSLSLECETGCGLEYTRYPVLFMHGMAGTEAYIDVLDYWFQVEDYVRAPGFLVEIRAVDAFAGTETRSVQWLAHLDALVEAGIGRRFNLIAHSQGGLDARYLTSLLDTRGLVASVNTVATPHQGSSVADLAAGGFDAFPVDAATVNGVVEALAGLVGLAGPDLIAQLEDMTHEKMAQFNEDVLDVDGVYYSSWSGKSCATLDLACQLGNSGEIIDPLFAIPHGFMRLAEGENDGVTGVESCKWGDWQGSVPADHMDEVGQIADVFNPAFDHKAFYLEELRRLAARGL